MTVHTLVWKELWQRPLAVAACLLAITLGVAALVAIRSVTVFSEQAVGQQLEALGANVLILPQDVTLQDYYSADSNGKMLPEEHATRLAMANLEGVEQISPKLCVPTELNGRKITVAGILPQSEFQAKAAWQSVQLLGKKHAGCKRAIAPGDEGGSASECLAKNRFIRELAADEVFVGADIAGFAKIGPGDRITLLDQSLKVTAVLPATGTVDDGRVFAHLHTVQAATAAGEVVNAIEVMACCEDAAGNLVAQLSEMFRDAKVVTISHVVQTQVSVNRLMARLSYVFFGILIAVSTASIAGTMFANVTERRREIGTLMALGAKPSLIAGLFIGKALVVGLAGGVLGFLGGSVVAVGVGPQLAGVAVVPVPSLAVVSVLLAGTVALVASYLPARRAALLDPCLCFREV